MPVENQPRPNEARRASIRDAARAAIEEEGPEGLIIRRLCERIGVHAPNLYRQFEDKTAIEAAVAEQAFEELAEAVREHGNDLAEPAAVRALASAYRQWASEHPHVYRLMLCRPSRAAAGDLLAEDRLISAFRELTGAEEESAWSMLAALHGFVVLEIDGRLNGPAEGTWNATLLAMESAASR